MDYLVATARTLPGLTSDSVSDGFPAGVANPAFAVGVVPFDDGDTANEVVHAQLGAQMERETYEIPCEIAVGVGGGEEAAKAVRDQAFGIFDAFVTEIRRDRTLGGALHSGAALVTRVRMDQTATPEEAGRGRICSIKFAVRCDNRF
ncbi:hypothetical protein OOK41_31635 [Micromonospora sp. NBC_01655]|uniref:hypothetical protein n=1 Tax=Micromonospora sp. NBC_01655 TaxID=2975983 RepID=UPI0022518A54|nr:hypothetical protein [Micromonospora sp. NBC_01655]MCX4474814.1 hypothetical protein [Micromonospora sp. NBC_01655]